jgi:ferredoxin
VFPSPVGALIHPVYGLSHSYRGALAFADEPAPREELGEIDSLPIPSPLAAPVDFTAPNPCDSCEGKPCLSACPVGAFSAAGYAVEACAEYLRLPGGKDCMDSGCRARRACPIGRDYAQSPEQARFHMAAFLAARTAG